MSCAFAYDIVVGYYLKQSTDFKVGDPSSGRTVEVVCDKPRQFITCGPLGTSQSYVTFTLPT